MKLQTSQRFVSSSHGNSTNEKWCPGVGAYPRHVPQQPVRLVPGGEQDQGAPGGGDTVQYSIVQYSVYTGGGDPVQGPAPAAVQPGAETAVPSRARPGQRLQYSVFIDCSLRSRPE